MKESDKNPIEPGQVREADPGQGPSPPASKPGPADPVLILLTLLVLITTWGWIGRLFDLRFSIPGQLPGLLILSGLSLAAVFFHLQGRGDRERRRGAAEREERILAETLRARISFQEAVLENAAEGVCVCRLLEKEPDPAFFLWNKRMSGITGYEMEQINALGFYRALFPSPGPRAEAREGMLRLAAGEKAQAGEWTITRADGRQRTVSISISTFKTGGKTNHLFLARDISDKAEARGTPSEASLQELIHHAPVGLLGLDLAPATDRLNRLKNLGTKELKDFLLEHPDEALRLWGAAKVFDANRTALDLFKADDLDELGRSWPGAASPGPAAALGAGLAEIMAQGGVFQAEIDSQDPEDGDRRFHVHLFLLRDDGGSGIRLLVALSDITGLKKVEDALRREKDRLELAARAAGMGIWDWDLEAGRLYLDPGLKAILGYRDDEPIDPIKVWEEVLNPPEGEPAGPTLPEHQDGPGRPINLERRIVDRDGRVRWLMIRGESVQDRDGRSVRMVGTAIDVTGRKREEGAGQWSAALVESAPSAITGLTLEGLITTWNKKAEKIFGYSSDEIIGQHLFYLFPPERTSEATRTMARIRAGERVELPSSELLSGEGRRVQVSLSFFPIRNGGGDITGAAFIVRDLEPTQVTDRELKAQRETVDAFLKASPVGICRISNRVLEWASPAFYRMLGYPQGALKGMEIRPLFPHQAEFLRVGRSMLDQFAGKGRAGIDTRWVRKDGRIINCHPWSPGPWIPLIRTKGRSWRSWM